MKSMKFTVYQTQQFLNRLLDNISYNEYLLEEFSHKEDMFDELIRVLSLIDPESRDTIHQVFWEGNKKIPNYKLKEALAKLKDKILCQ